MPARRATARVFLLACLAATSACGAASRDTTTTPTAAPFPSSRDAAFWQAQVEAVADVVAAAGPRNPPTGSPWDVPGGVRGVATDEGRVTAVLFAAHVAVRSDDRWQTLALPEPFDAAALHRLGRRLVIVGSLSMGERRVGGESESGNGSERDVRLAWLTVDGTHLGTVRQGPSLVVARVSGVPQVEAIQASAVAASEDAILVLGQRGRLHALNVDEAHPAPFAALPSTWNVPAMAMVVRDAETLWLSDGERVFAWTREGVRQIDETASDTRASGTEAEASAGPARARGDTFFREGDRFRFDGRRWVAPAHEGRRILRRDGVPFTYDSASDVAFDVQRREGGTVVVLPPPETAPNGNTSIVGHMTSDGHLWIVSTALHAWSLVEWDGARWTTHPLAGDGRRFAGTDVPVLSGDIGCLATFSSYAVDATGNVPGGRGVVVWRDGRVHMALPSAEGARVELAGNRCDGLYAVVSERVETSLTTRVHRYDPSLGRFARLPDPPGAMLESEWPSSDESRVVVADGRVLYLVRGGRVRRFDGTAWETLELGVTPLWLVAFRGGVWALGRGATSALVMEQVETHARVDLAHAVASITPIASDPRVVHVMGDELVVELDDAALFFDGTRAAVDNLTELAEALVDGNGLRWVHHRIALDEAHALVAIQRRAETPTPSEPVEFFVVDARDRVLGRARVAAPAPD
jgi:hypothetical protein